MDWVGYFSSFFTGPQGDDAQVAEFGQEVVAAVVENQQEQEPVAELGKQEMSVVLPEYAVGYNHLIVREIAEYLPVAALQKLRAVSRHWNNNFSSAYFRESTVSLNRVGDLTRYTEEIEELVHSQFKLHFRRHGEGQIFLIHPETLHPFFEKYGEQIAGLELTLRLAEHPLQPLRGWLGLLRTLENVKELSIDWDFWGNVPPVPYVVPELPSLQKLAIDVNDEWNVIHFDNAVQFGRSFVHVILSMAPNLQYLIVWNLSTNRGQQDWRSNFYSGLVEGLNLLPSSRLNQLCFNGSFGILDILLEFPVPLTKLTIHLDKRPNGQTAMDTIAYNHLNRLLWLHAETLEHLYLEVQSVQVAPAIQRICLRLPEKMPKLLSLKLRFEKRVHASHTDKFELPMTPITDYQERFPKLETLWVSTCLIYSILEHCRECVQGVMFPEGGRACNSLRNVGLQMPDERFQYDFMKKRNDLQSEIVRMFPNAKMEIFERGFVPDPKYVI